MLSERTKLLSQILKVMLEAVTATTFVMLDRLFYEALDVVRKHAMKAKPSSGIQDLEIKVWWRAKSWKLKLELSKGHVIISVN